MKIGRDLFFQQISWLFPWFLEANWRLSVGISQFTSVRLPQKRRRNKKQWVHHELMDCCSWNLSFVSSHIHRFWLLFCLLVNRTLKDENLPGEIDGVFFWRCALHQLGEDGKVGITQCHRLLIKGSEAGKRTKWNKTQAFYFVLGDNTDTYNFSDFFP